MCLSHSFHNYKIVFKVRISSQLIDGSNRKETLTSDSIFKLMHIIYLYFITCFFPFAFSLPANQDDLKKILVNSKMEFGDQMINFRTIIKIGDL